MIRHIVAMRFRDGLAPDTKAAIFRDLAALSGHIDGIADFRTLANVSPETAVVHGFRDLFWFDFRDAAVRDA
jgi:Stress responsive A/B Barrel Domain